MRIALVVALLLAAPNLAHADDWYGEQTGASDACAFALTYGGVVKREPVAVAVGVAVYVLGAPAIHLLHGEDEHAGASLAARIVVPLGFAGLGLAHWRNTRGGTGPAVFGRFSRTFGVMFAVLGALMVAAIDASTAQTKDEAVAPRMLAIGGTF